jgi:uncharacterized membrane protein
MEVETSSGSWTTQVSRSIRASPADLVGVAGFIAVVNVVFLVPGLRDATVAGASLRTLLGIPALLFLPGYVLVAIGLPASAARRTGAISSRTRRRGSIDLVERVALSFGMSVALLPLYGVVLGTWWTITLSSVLTSLSVLLLGGLGLAAIRRFRLQPEDRFGTTLGSLSSRTARPITRSTNGLRSASTVLLIVALVLAVGAMGFAVATPYQSGQSSTLYLVSENESGATVAAGFPTSLAVDETTTMSVGIENDEERTQAYTVAVELERIAPDVGDARVLDSQSVARLHPTVDAGQSWTGSHTVTPRLAGDGLRLHYYLYRGTSAPEEPSTATAYRDAYLWVDVAGA